MRQIGTPGNPSGGQAIETSDDPAGHALGNDLEDREVARIRSIVRLMDEAVPIPGTRIRVGLDGLIGLIPGFGDAVGALVSAYLVIASVRVGVGAPIAGRMLLNLGIDALVGLVPLLGDLFDIGWKANRRNLNLLESWRMAPNRTRRRSALVLSAVTVGVLGTVSGVVWLAFAVVRAVVAALAG